MVLAEPMTTLSELPLTSLRAPLSGSVVPRGTPAPTITSFSILCLLHPHINFHQPSPHNSPWLTTLPIRHTTVAPPLCPQHRRQPPPTESPRSNSWTAASSRHATTRRCTRHTLPTSKPTGVTSLLLWRSVLLLKPWTCSTGPKCSTRSTLSRTSIGT